MGKSCQQQRHILSPRRLQHSELSWSWAPTDGHQTDSDPALSQGAFKPAKRITKWNREEALGQGGRPDLGLVLTLPLTCCMTWLTHLTSCVQYPPYQTYANQSCGSDRCIGLHATSWPRLQGQVFLGSPAAPPAYTQACLGSPQLEGEQAFLRYCGILSPLTLF